jgi:maltose/maltodextrin transport system permease protein
MQIPPVLRRYLGPALAVLGVLLALYMVTVVYATGETLLAMTILVMVALAVWIYNSEKVYAFRYLFPGIAAALIFVVFPIIYTFGLGFTNYSSKNLLEFKRATRYLLEQTYQSEGPTYNFTLHPSGGKFVGRLEDVDSGKAFVTEPLAMVDEQTVTLKAEPVKDGAAALAAPLELMDLIKHQKAFKKITILMPDGAREAMTGLREFGPVSLLYAHQADGTLKNRQTGVVLKPNFKTGFYETPDGDGVEPGFQAQVGWANYKDILTDEGLREPFWQIFVWTLVFSSLTVVFATSLGLLLAVLLSWDALRFKVVYRLLLFLPYAVPSFISILVFKGLFNNNFGEINLILGQLFGIKPLWFSSPFMAKTMILIVNTWLGFPYMMLICMGLIKAIPMDLYEASAIAGAGPLTNFFRITVPLIRRPLTPLLISSFAFNFNNFVLISLLTGGRPDLLNTSVPAGTTDILVSYTYRIAFQDSGQKFGLAAAISTLIFLMVAAVSLIQIRATKIAKDEPR